MKAALLQHCEQGVALGAINDELIVWHMIKS
jgi:hypothetical protein